MLLDSGRLGGGVGGCGLSEGRRRLIVPVVEGTWEVRDGMRV